MALGISILTTPSRNCCIVKIYCAKKNESPLKKKKKKKKKKRKKRKEKKRMEINLDLGGKGGRKRGGGKKKRTHKWKGGVQNNGSREL